MQCLPKDQLLDFHPGTLEEVRKIYNFNKPEEISKAVDILNEWVQSQNHFIKKDYPIGYLERTIITTKGSVERAKTRLDKACTFRTLMPSYFGVFDLKNDFKDIDVITHAVVPKMTEDYCRIYIMKNAGKKFEPTFCLNYFRVCLMMAEYIRLHDYSNGYHVILDYTEVNLTELATKMNIVDLRQGLTILMEAYGIRVKGIHILSSSKLVEMVVTIFKQVLSAKMGQRIHVHKTLESLHQVIPKDLLPIEYGGKENSLKDLQNKWTDIQSTTEHRQRQREMNKATTNEALRHTDTFNDKYMGMPGTFRTLSVD